MPQVGLNCNGNTALRPRAAGGRILPGRKPASSSRLRAASGSVGGTYGPRALPPMQRSIWRPRCKAGPWCGWSACSSRLKPSSKCLPMPETESEHLERLWREAWTPPDRQDVRKCAEKHIESIPYTPSRGAFATAQSRGAQSREASPPSATPAHPRTQQTHPRPLLATPPKAR